MDEQNCQTPFTAEDILEEIAEKREETAVEAEETVLEEQPKKQKATALESVYDLLSDFVGMLIIVTALFTLFFRMVMVDGESMHDTLADGDRLLLQTAFYTPDRGDIVVIYQETQPNEPLIKRVIALGGDSVRLDVSANDGRGAVYLKKAGTEDWQQLSEDYVHYPLSWGILFKDENGYAYGNEVTVPEDSVFVLGDHRNNSRDSRAFGFVSEEDIVGHALFRVMPVSDFGLVE